jgi:hypothetical protein
MMSRRMTAPTNSTLFASLIGQTARGCWLGYGNCLFLEFGESRPSGPRETHPRGEWGLWCDQIEWRIEQGDRVIAGSEDDRSTMEAGIHEINGKSFLSGEIFRSGDSILTFSDGLILRTFVITAEEDANWNFRDQNGDSSSFGPDHLPFASTQPGVEVTRGTDRLQQLSSFLWNSKVWRASIDVQHRFEDGYEPSDLDSVRLDFRLELPKPTGKVGHQQTGSLQIDPSTSGLRLERANKIIAACGDSSERVLTEFRQLVGKTLLRIDVARPGGDTDFVLEDGLLLRCFPATTKTGEAWRISSVENDELVLGPGGQWSYAGGLK